MINSTEGFNREAVLMAPNSSLPRDRFAEDLGIGKSTLCKCGYCTIGRLIRDPGMG